jgi:hypothetical protein
MAGRSARLYRDTIANEARIDQSKVSFCTRWLEKNGLLEISGRGGRGLANVYRIIPDAEASPAPRETGQTTAAETAAENGADFGIETAAENGADFGQNGADFGAPTRARGRLTERRTDPPSGGDAHAREGGFSVHEEDDTSQSDDADRRRQPPLLLPIAGSQARGADQQRAGKRLPEDFVVPPPWIAEAAAAREELHLGPADLEVEAVKFANHWISEDGDKAVKRDWLRTWINWCLNPIVKAIDADKKPQQKKSTAQRLMEAALDQVRASK